MNLFSNDDLIFWIENINNVISHCIKFKIFNFFFTTASAKICLFIKVMGCNFFTSAKNYVIHTYTYIYFKLQKYFHIFYYQIILYKYLNLFC